MTKINNGFYQELEKIIKPYFEGINPCHNFSHSYRVMNMGLHIGKIEGADLDIIKTAALLHDVGRKKDEDSKGKICHAMEGGKMSREILTGFDLEKYFIEEVVHCVETHRFRQGNPPKTIEAKSIYDADKLDAIGGIGILRSASFSGFFGAEVHNPYVDIEMTKEYGGEDSAYREYLIKLVYIKDKMLTAEGRRIAEGRDKRMRKFFEDVNLECSGEL